MIQVKGINKNGTTSSKLYGLGAFLRVDSFAPILNLYQPIIVQPEPFIDRMPDINDYPIRIIIELCASVQVIDFDIMFVYDER